MRDTPIVAIFCGKLKPQNNLHEAVGSGAAGYSVPSAQTAQRRDPGKDSCCDYTTNWAERPETQEVCTLLTKTDRLKSQELPRSLPFTI